ncbi:MAG: hypothetical protein ACO3A2_07640 [Bdellovibrionia bacterium]
MHRFTLFLLNFFVSAVLTPLCFLFSVPCAWAKNADDLRTPLPPVHTSRDVEDAFPWLNSPELYSPGQLLTDANTGLIQITLGRLLTQVDSPILEEGDPSPIQFQPKPFYTLVKRAARGSLCLDLLTQAELDPHLEQVVIESLESFDPPLLDQSRRQNPGTPRILIKKIRSNLYKAYFLTTHTHQLFPHFLFFEFLNTGRISPSDEIEIQSMSEASSFNAVLEAVLIYSLLE